MESNRGGRLPGIPPSPENNKEPKNHLETIQNAIKRLETSTIFASTHEYDSFYLQLYGSLRVIETQLETYIKTGPITEETSSKHTKNARTFAQGKTAVEEDGIVINYRKACQETMEKIYMLFRHFENIFNKNTSKPIDTWTPKKHCEDFLHALRNIFTAATLLQTLNICFDSIDTTIRKQAQETRDDLLGNVDG